MTMTPAEHRDQAEKDLEALNSCAPDEPAYHGLAASASAHCQAAMTAYMQATMSAYLDAITATLAARPAAQSVPGMPEGWSIETRQNAGGNRKWGYALASPDGRMRLSHHRWDTSEGALTAGIVLAQSLSDAAGEPEPGEGTAPAATGPLTCPQCLAEMPDLSRREGHKMDCTEPTRHGQAPEQEG